MKRIYTIAIVAISIISTLGIFNITQASEGDVWLTPVVKSVKPSTNFDIEVHMDTGGKDLGGFNMYFDFTTTDVTIDTTQGTDGVDKGSDSSSYTMTINATDIANGHLRFAGVATSGYANGSDVHIATIHAKTTSAFTSGTTNLSLRVNELLDQLSNNLTSGTTTGAIVTYPVTDTTSPTLAEVTAVSTPTSDSTPNYTFSSTEAGTITYGGSCSSSTTQASIGNNTISFSSLSDGTYSDCTITVTDASSNASSALSVTSFVVNTSIPDNTAPSRSGKSVSKNDSNGAIQAILSFNTDESATCKYSTLADATYDSMTETFTTTGGTVHQTTVDNLVAGNDYNFYVKCEDSNGNKNTSDYQMALSTVIATVSADDANTTVIENSSTEIDVKTPKVKINKKGANIKLSKNKKVYSKETKIKFKGSVSGLSNGKVQVYVNKKLKYTFNIGNDGNWGKKIKLKKNGTHTIKFKYLDSNNNVISESSSYRVKIDTKKPKFKKMLSFLNKHRGDKIWWKATDNNKISYYKYYFNGKKKKTKRASFIVPASTQRGLHTLKIKAYDKAGNRAIKYVVINVR